MLGWIKKRRLAKRQELVQDIAVTTYKLLKASNGWEKFLPPVALNGHIYMVTENGSVYRLSYDPLTEMEQIMQIRSR